MPGDLTILLLGAVAVVATVAVVMWQSRARRRLRHTEARLTWLLGAVQEGMLRMDAHGKIIDASPVCLNMLGFVAHEVIGKYLHALPVKRVTPAQLQDLQALLLRVEGAADIDFFRADGSILPCRVNVLSESADSGEPATLCLLLTDLSSSKQHDANLRQVLAMFENTAEGVMLTDLQGNILSINPAFTRITGYAESEVLGRNSRFLQSGRHDPKFYRKIWAGVATNGRWQGEMWNRRKNGEIYPEWLTISAIRDASGQTQSYVGVFSDISHIKRSELELARLAHYDQLTNLPNRSLLSSHLKLALNRARRHGERVAVMILDLDGFKTVNDSLGHPAGDLLLQQVATRLRDALRQEDTVARLGGDEFAIVIEPVNADVDLAEIAAKLIRVVSTPMDLQGHSALVTASVGVALCPDDGVDPTDLLKAADTAMYASKQAGRNTFQFHHPDMARAAQLRLTLEHGLRHAIDKNELEVWYQAQIDLASGNLIGAEALVRWRDAEHGMVPPARFIPVAEETGLVLSLGEWVLRQACLHTRQWQAQGLMQGPVSVNVSGPQIERGDFYTTVVDVLAETGLSPEGLVLEITESFLLRNADQAMLVVAKLNGLGVRVAIDDFGTGYSSLSYLKDLRADKLKIDQRFVRDLPDDSDDVAITRAVIALGHSLGFTVVAEGVETEAQRAFLQHEGCDEAQGYFYSRPLPGAEFEALLRDYAQHGHAVLAGWLPEPPTPTLEANQDAG